MTNRAYRKDELFVRVADHQLFQHGCHGSDRQPFAGKLRRGAFQAVRHDLSAHRMPPAPGRPQRKDHLVALPEKSGCFLQGGIGIRQERSGCRTGCQGMVPERASQSASRSHFDAIRFRKRNPRLQARDGIADRHRIVQGAEGIDTDPKTRLGEFPADIVGETTAQHQQAVFIGKQDRTAAGINGRQKFYHGGHFLNQTKIAKNDHFCYICMI